MSDHQLGYLAVALCCVIAITDPVAWLRKRRRRAAAATPTPQTSVPPPPPRRGCEDCALVEVVKYQVGLEPLELARLQAPLDWHRRTRRPEGRA